MNSTYYTTAFLPQGRDAQDEALKQLLLDALAAFPFKVEIDSADGDDKLEDLIDEQTRQEFAANGVHDLDDISRDLLLSLDGYSILVAITEGDDAAELASAFDEDDALTPEELEVLERTCTCIEFFAEESDPEERFHAAMEAISDKLRSEWGAVVIQGEIID